MIARLWRALDLDARDLHYYGGLVLLSTGVGLLSVGLGFIAFGLGLLWPAVRRPLVE